MHEEVDLEPAVIVNNADWYQNMNIVDFHASYGMHFRMAKLLRMETVKSRLEQIPTKENPHVGMSHNEFFYQVFQRFDIHFALGQLASGHLAPKFAHFSPN